MSEYLNGNEQLNPKEYQRRYNLNKIKCRKIHKKLKSKKVQQNYIFYESIKNSITMFDIERKEKWAS